MLVTLENITKFLFDAEIFDAIECAKAQMKFWSPMVLVKNKKKTLYLLTKMSHWCIQNLVKHQINFVCENS